MESRVKGEDEEEMTKDGSLDKTGGGEFSIGKVAGVSNLEGAVTKVVLEIVEKVALDIDLVNVVDKCRDVECVVGVL